MLHSSFPVDTIATELMALPIRPSSAKTYQSHWLEFLSFLKRVGVTQMSQCTLNHVARFLNSLYRKGLIASTVANYRSALSVPLRTVLNIDLLDPAVSAWIRPMSLHRPARPLTVPSWNLQTVLDYLEGLPAHLAFDDSLARAAFLVLLCTGWRISELQACVKLSDYCLITHEGIPKLTSCGLLGLKRVVSFRWPHSYREPL